MPLRSSAVRLLRPQLSCSRAVFWLRSSASSWLQLQSREIRAVLALRSSPSIPSQFLQSRYSSAILVLISGAAQPLSLSFSMSVFKAVSPVRFREFSSFTLRFTLTSFELPVRSTAPQIRLFLASRYVIFGKNAIPVRDAIPRFGQEIPVTARRSSSVSQPLRSVSMYSATQARNLASGKFASSTAISGGVKWIAALFTGSLPA